MARFPAAPLPPLGRSTLLPVWPSAFRGLVAVSVRREVKTRGPGADCDERIEEGTGGGAESTVLLSGGGNT